MVHCCSARYINTSGCRRTHLGDLVRPLFTIGRIESFFVMQYLTDKHLAKKRLRMTDASRYNWVRTPRSVPLALGGNQPPGVAHAIKAPLEMSPQSLPRNIGRNNPTKRIVADVT